MWDVAEARAINRQVNELRSTNDSSPPRQNGIELRTPIDKSPWLKQREGLRNIMYNLLRSYKRSPITVIKGRTRPVQVSTNALPQMSSITPTGPPTFIPPSQYGYTPHEYVAVIFLVVFGMSTSEFRTLKIFVLRLKSFTVLHIGQATYYRMWWLFPTTCLCGIGEIIGWGGRLWSSFSPDLHKPFMMQCALLICHRQTKV